MSSSSTNKTNLPSELLPALKPKRPTTPKPTKPDYFPLSAAQRPLGPSIYPALAAAEDKRKINNITLTTDALHDMSFYTEVSHALPDAGRPVLNSVLFSQRHVVNDSPSIEEEIAGINEKTRLWRAARLQDVITKYETSKQQTSLEKSIEIRIKEKEAAERERTLRRISRMLNTLLPELEKAISKTESIQSEMLSASRQEMLQKQWKERSELQQQILNDMRVAERRWLVDRQFQRNMEERNSLDSKHYFSYLELQMEERLTFRGLCEQFYNEKILVGITDDEREIRVRVEKRESECRLDIMEQMQKCIPLKELENFDKIINNNVLQEEEEEAYNKEKENSESNEELELTKEVNTSKEPKESVAKLLANKEEENKEIADIMEQEGEDQTVNNTEVDTAEKEISESTEVCKSTEETELTKEVNTSKESKESVAQLLANKEEAKKTLEEI